MRFRRLFWQLYSSFLAVILLVLLILIVFGSRSFSRFYRSSVQETLLAKAHLVAASVQELLDADNHAQLNALCKVQGQQSSTRITIVLVNGRVIADSEEEPWRMDNHRDREEIRDAIEGRVGISSRFSATIGEELMYVAIPVQREGQVKWVVRTSVPVGFIQKRIAHIQEKIVRYGLVTAVIAAGLAVMISRRIARPLEDMRVGAQRFARGQFDQKVSVPESTELGSLASAMNEMALELDRRISSSAKQSQTLETILSSMAEGLIAVNWQSQVIRINRAACEILGVEASASEGKSLEEVVRVVELQDFIKQALRQKRSLRREIVFPDRQTKVWLAYAQVLEKQQKRDIAAIIVINDVTQMRRLENVRRDFVANVSHELKTPITSIKGFVETLLDGAIHKPEDARRFLKIIARHTNRLNAIIEDILILSRVEDEASQDTIPLEAGEVRDVILGAVETCYLKSSEKNISIEVECPAELEAMMNAFMLEQALVNLLDNAIKYSEAGSRVVVSGSTLGDEVVISVEDCGCGIPEEHLNRIFERFYVTDKARSRKLGGTGLGLAIVKHIASVHGGYVDVRSQLGRGSVFTIYLRRDSLPRE